MSESYIAHVCKNCDCVFMDIDSIDINTFAPDYKYCPKCVKLGYKNTKEAKELYKIKSRFEDLIYNEGSGVYPSPNEIWLLHKCQKIAKEYKSFGKNIHFRSIYKQALELLSYEGE